MVSKTLTPPITDIFLTVINPAWSLDTGVAAQEYIPGTVASGHIYRPGEVLSLVNTKYIPYDNSNPAVGVAYTRADATNADAPIVVLARGGCVDVQALIWPDGFTGLQKADGLADLKALFIIPRSTL